MSIMNKYPWERLDDLFLFLLMFILIVVVSYTGHWDLVSNLSSAFFGAITMYIRSDKTSHQKPPANGSILGVK